MQVNTKTESTAAVTSKADGQKRGLIQADWAAHEKTGPGHNLEAFGKSLNSFHAGLKPLSIPAGLVKQDEPLGCGPYDGIHILGASSTIGKTTFSMQIADQIAIARQTALPSCRNSR